MEESNYTTCHDSILINSSYKRKIDKLCENVFVMPIKKSKHAENKLYAENVVLETPLEDADVECFEREETFYDSYNNNITFKTPIPEADPEEIKNNAKNVDDLATSENEILNIEEQVCEKIEQESVNEAIAPTNETIERTAALDQTTDMDKEPKEPNSPIQSFNEISQKVKNRVLNKEFLDLYLNDGYDRQISNCQLVDNRVSPIIDTRVKSNYCFKTDDFLEAMSEYRGTLDTHTKRTIFKFISLACHQIMNIIFETVNGWHIYSLNTRLTLVKCFTNLIYDICEDQLIVILESKFKKGDRIFTSVAHILECILALMNDKNLHKKSLNLNPILE